MQPVEEMEIQTSEVVDYLRITGNFAPALREVVARKIAVESARKAGITVTDEELQRAADVFRSCRNLHKAADTEAWMQGSGVTPEALEAYLETSLLVGKFKDHLAGQSDKQKYLESEGIESTVREMIYRDWLQQTLQ